MKGRAPYVKKKSEAVDRCASNVEVWAGDAVIPSAEMIPVLDAMVKNPCLVGRSTSIDVLT
jgi:hypothetical protein